jgi:hypothetical protein
MKRVLCLLGGAVLILLGLAKVASLFYALTVHSPAPARFILKQVVYAVSLIGAGLATMLARPRSQHGSIADDTAHEASH